jgi:hypothetical protein
MQQFLQRFGILKSKPRSSSQITEAYALLESETRELRSALTTAEINLCDLTRQLESSNAKIQELSSIVAARDSRISELMSSIQRLTFSGQGSLGLCGASPAAAQSSSPRSSTSISATTPPLSARGRMRELGSRKLLSALGAAPAAAPPPDPAKQSVAKAPAAAPSASTQQLIGKTPTGAPLAVSAAKQSVATKDKPSAVEASAPQMTSHVSLAKDPGECPEAKSRAAEAAERAGAVPCQHGNSSDGPKMSEGPKMHELPMARKLPPPAPQPMPQASPSSNARHPSEHPLVPASGHDVIYDARLKEVHSGGGGTSQARAALLGEPASLLEATPADASADPAVHPQLRVTAAGLVEARARPVGTWIDAPLPMPDCEARANGWLDTSQKITPKLKEMQAKSFLVGAASDAQRLATIDVFVERGALTFDQGERVAAAVAADSFEKTVVEAAFECTESDAASGMHKSAALELHSDGGAILNLVDGRTKPVVWMYAFASAAEESDEQTLRLTGTCISDHAIGEAASFWLEFLNESGGWRGLVGAPDSDPGGIGDRWEVEFLPS